MVIVEKPLVFGFIMICGVLLVLNSKLHSFRVWFLYNCMLPGKGFGDYKCVWCVDFTLKVISIWDWHVIACSKMM